MTKSPRILGMAALLLALGGGTAVAGNQSWNTSSNCSDGVCTVWDRFSRDDGDGWRGGRAEHRAWWGAVPPPPQRWAAAPWERRGRGDWRPAEQRRWRDGPGRRDRRDDDHDD